MKPINLINIIRSVRAKGQPEWAFGDPRAVYLTYSGDPSTTMDVFSHADIRTGCTPKVFYREKGERDWLEQDGTTTIFPYSGEGFSQTERHVYRTILTGLSPGTEYEFCFVKNGGVIRYFRTIEENPDSIRVVYSGDLHIQDKYRLMARTIARERPDVIVISGDWTYADGLESRYDRWITFWDDWTEHIVDDGYMPPIVPGIGNHEVIGGYGGSIPEDAPYFYACFPEMEIAGGYRAFDFPDEILSIICLDTEHTNPEITGSDDQSVWLQDTLSERSNYKHVVGAYHVAGWPSVQQHTNSFRTRVRNWNAIFENAGNVRMVFEHHGHTYKRSVPLLNGEEHPDGIRYLGDGNWGMTDHRDVWNPNTTFYLEAAYGNIYKEGPDGPHPLDGQDALYEERARHFWLVEYQPDKANLKSINKNNEVFHEFEIEL